MRFMLVLLACAVLVGGGCAQAPGRPAPAAPAVDPRIGLGEPKVSPRAGAAGAPVDCSIEVANRSQQTLSRLTVRCELLDQQGMPVGVGLGSLSNLAGGESRAVRTVVYGVRSFATARAQVSGASFE